MGMINMQIYAYICYMLLLLFFYPRYQCSRGRF